MSDIRLKRGTKCSCCGRGVGTRHHLGDPHGPVRIAFCPHCDIAATSIVGRLPRGAREALEKGGRSG